jgi:hypothetical protein
MEAQYGTEQAIERILSPEWPETSWQQVLAPLWEANRLQWSAEAAALMFPELFSEQAKAEAQRRLDQFGFRASQSSP